MPRKGSPGSDQTDRPAAAARWSQAHSHSAKPVHGATVRSAAPEGTSPHGPARPTSSAWTTLDRSLRGKLRSHPWRATPNAGERGCGWGWGGAVSAFSAAVGRKRVHTLQESHSQGQTEICTAHICTTHCAQMFLLPLFVIAKHQERRFHQQANRQIMGSPCKGMLLGNETMNYDTHTGESANR